MIETLKQIVIEGGTINEEQAVALSQSPDKEALYKAAHQITRHFMGNKFDTCSIINAKSGNCSENCKWCAQSGHYNTVVALYPYYRPKNVFIRHYTIASRESNASDWLPAANVYRTEKSGN